MTVSASIAATISALFTARPHAIAPTWIVSPANIGALSALDPMNVPTRFKGYPLVSSPGAGANLIFVDAPAIAVADDGVELECPIRRWSRWTMRPRRRPPARCIRSLARQHGRHSCRAVSQLESRDGRRAVHGDVDLMRPEVLTRPVVEKSRIDALTRILTNLKGMRADGWQSDAIASYLAHERADLAVLAMEIDLALHR